MGFSGSMSVGTLSAITMYFLAWNLIDGSIFSQIFLWLSLCASKIAVWSESASSIMPLSWMQVTEQIFPVFIPISIIVLFSSSFSCKLFR